MHVKFKRNLQNIKRCTANNFQSFISNGKNFEGLKIGATSSERNTSGKEKTLSSKAPKKILST